MQSSNIFYQQMLTFRRNGSLPSVPIIGRFYKPLKAQIKPVLAQENLYAKHELSPRCKRSSSVGTIYKVKRKNPSLASSKIQSSQGKCEQIIASKLMSSFVAVRSPLQQMLGSGNTQGNISKINFAATMPRHIENKSILQSRLEKIINDYQSKNEQLDKKLIDLQKVDRIVQKSSKKTVPPTPQLTNSSFEENLLKMEEFILKNIGVKELQGESFQTRMMNQVKLQERLRVMRFFINENNLQQVYSWMKKTDVAKMPKDALMSKPQEYDPLAVQKFEFLFKDYSIAERGHWIAQQFASRYTLCQEHWRNYFTRTALFQYFPHFSPHTNSQFKLTLKELVQWLSVHLKCSLKSRNVARLYLRVRNSLLEQIIQTAK